MQFFSSIILNLVLSGCGSSTFHGDCVLKYLLVKNVCVIYYLCSVRAEFVQVGHFLSPWALLVGGLKHQ